MRQLLEQRAIDVLQPDVHRVGGISEAQKVWALAAAHDIPVIPHAGQSHNYHLVISHLNSPLAEYFPPPPEGVVPDMNEPFSWIVATPLARDILAARLARVVYRHDQDTVTLHTISAAVGVQADAHDEKPRPAALARPPQAGGVR